MITKLKADEFRIELEALYRRHKMQIANTYDGQMKIYSLPDDEAMHESPLEMEIATSDKA